MAPRLRHAVGPMRIHPLIAAGTLALCGLAPATLAAPPNLRFETAGGIKISLPWYLQ